MVASLEGEPLRMKEIAPQASQPWLVALLFMRHFLFLKAIVERIDGLTKWLHDF